MVMRDVVDFFFFFWGIWVGFQQVDLDLGNYERFLDVTLTRDNNITTGKIYQVTCILLAKNVWPSLVSSFELLQVTDKCLYL